MLKFLMPLWFAIAVVTIGGCASGNAAIPTEFEVEGGSTPLTTNQPRNEHIVAMVMPFVDTLFKNPELQVYTRKRQVSGWVETETGEVHPLFGSLALPRVGVKHILLFKSRETFPIEGKESVHFDLKTGIGSVRAPDPEFKVTVVPGAVSTLILVYHMGMSRVNQNLNLWSEAFVIARVPPSSATGFATLMRDLGEQERTFALPSVCKYTYATPSEYVLLYEGVQRWFNKVEWVGVEKIDPNTHIAARLARQDRVIMFIMDQMLKVTCQSDPG